VSARLIAKSMVSTDINAGQVITVKALFFGAGAGGGFRRDEYSFCRDELTCADLLQRLEATKMPQIPAYVHYHWALSGSHSVERPSRDSDSLIDNRPTKRHWLSFDDAALAEFRTGKDATIQIEGYRMVILALDYVDLSILLVEKFL